MLAAPCQTDPRREKQVTDTANYPNEVQTWLGVMAANMQGYVLVFVCKSSVRPTENKHLITVTHQAHMSTSDGMLC